MREAADLLSPKSSFGGMSFLKSLCGEIKNFALAFEMRNSCQEKPEQIRRSSVLLHADFSSLLCGRR